MARLADRIRGEAREQRRLKAAGQPIPPEARVYARKAGLAIAAVCGAATIAVLLIAVYEGTLYYAVAAFFLFFVVVGVVQAMTGRHIITGTERT